ncbi:MAG TPA: D-2-hydroxyacid dehydrogenase [Thermoanaerobaculia bacterium]|nr:D-2-hydroxyacid dehydrogenase [Thermoanaerobaculia bacterium]
MRLVAVAPPTFTALHLLTEAGIEFVATTDPAELGEADVIVMAPRYGSLLRGLDAPHLQWIHALGAGVDTFPFDELGAITITNSRGLYADALAEFVIGAMVWFAKDFPRLFRNQAEHRWEPYIVERLEGKTIGIIGFGGTGRAIARRADALTMKIITSRRSAADPRAFEADYVVLCVPLTSETRGLMSAERIARMPPHSVLINVSRGAVVDECALVDALCEKRIRGAALDVFATEPLPPDHPLWTLDNVLISPHTADRAADSHERAMRFFIENWRRFERGEELENVVDPRVGY